jgi:hypothetical protein
MCEPLSSASKTLFFDLNFVPVRAQALPEAAAKYGKMKSLSDYFSNNDEGKLIESIRQICKIVAPDTILAELDPVYFTATEGFGPLFQFLHLCLPLFLGSSQDKTRQDKTTQDKNTQGKTRQDKTRQDKTRHDNTRQQ